MVLSIVIKCLETLSAAVFMVNIWPNVELKKKVPFPNSQFSSMFSNHSPRDKNVNILLDLNQYKSNYDLGRCHASL